MKKIIAMAVILTATAQAEPITYSVNKGPAMNLPPIPTGEPAPTGFSAELQSKIEASFRQNAEKMKALHPEQGKPPKTSFPSAMPPVAPPSGAAEKPVFSKETQSALDSSFSRVSMPSSNLASVGLVKPAALADMLVDYYREELMPQEGKQEKYAELTLTKEEKNAIKSPFLNLSKDSVDPSSAVGAALAGQRATDQAKFEEQNLFQIVRLKYSAREHEFQKPSRVAGGGF